MDRLTDLRRKRNPLLGRFSASMIATAATLAWVGGPGAAQTKGGLIEAPALLKAKAAVVKILTDPESARFQSLTAKTGTDWADRPIPIVCGLINAKNQFGGYGGFRPFIYSVVTDEVTIYIREQPSDNYLRFIRQCPELMK